MYACQRFSVINQSAVSLRSQRAAELTKVVVRGTGTPTAQANGDSLLYLAVCDYNNDVIETLERCDWVEEDVTENRQKLLGMKKFSRRAN